jgi:adenylate kinase family enzyme
MRLAITGVMCSGKTTIANYLINKYNYNKFSFADDIKLLATEIFGMKNKNRKLLQDFGTKMKEIDNLIWINRLDKKIKLANSNNIIIDDLRYPDELEYLKKNNFKILKLDISKELQLLRLKKTYPETYLEHYNCSNHESEQYIKNIEYDYYYNITDANENNIYEIIDTIITIQ